MSWCWRRSAAVWLPLLVAAAPCRAQGRTEVTAGVVALASRPAFYGAGLGLAWRDQERLRLAPALQLGAFGDGRFGARAELSLQFLLDPDRTRGLGLYGGGGLSAELEGGHVTPYLLLILGAESAPGGKGGPFVELGVGGGARVAIGYRWRHPSVPRR